MVSEARVIVVATEVTPAPDNVYVVPAKFCTAAPSAGKITPKYPPKKRSAAPTRPPRIFLYMP
jgi:hypothetical protein